MKPAETMRTWLFVARNTLHLDTLKNGEESWWCVARNCKPGERAFLYQPLTGIILQLEVLEFLKEAEMFCNSYQMATARIKVLNVSNPPRNRCSCGRRKSLLRYFREDVR